MFEILNTPLKHQIGLTNVTGWNQARMVLNSEFTKLERYHRSNISFIPNNHILVQLLNAANFKNGLLEEIAIDLSDQFDNMMTSLGIGSPYGRPDFSINSWFYNKRTYEILIQDSSLFNADDVYENWADARPVRILHHPFNDMSFAIPNGKYVNNGPAGYAVIMINPAMLAIQYKGYLDHCKRTTKIVQAPAIYVSQYPIFNMLKDHLDIAIRNRIIDTFLGNPLQPYRSSHSMALNNPTSYIDATVASVIKNIKAQPYKFNKVMEMMPAFSKETQRETLAFPFNAITHYTGWIFDVARAPVLDFLIHYGNVQPNFENNDYINDIKRSLREMEMDKSIPSNTPLSARYHIENLTKLTSVL